jgi:purine-cytosine permease-like protein
MLAGAVVAVGIRNPFLIVPLAITSHFVLDVLPHFGVHRHDSAKRNKHPLFQYVLCIDILLTIALLVALPFMLQDAVASWVLLLGMILAFAPDLVWIHHFYYERRYKKVRQEGRLSRFHAWIQWGERPWGVFIELVWFSAMGVLLGVLAA